MVYVAVLRSLGMKMILSLLKIVLKNAFKLVSNRHLLN